MSKDVYVIAQQRQGKIDPITYELLGKARELAEDLGQEVVAVLIGADIKEQASLLVAAGADQVLVAESPAFREYTTEPYAKVVCEVIKRREPEIVLYGATSIGRDLAPRVSARIHTGLTADCTGLEVEKESGLLLMTRPAFGGNLMATIVCEHHRPQMATVRPGVMQPLSADETRTGKVEMFAVDIRPEDQNIRICQVVKEPKERRDIMDAPILVSGGRGIGQAKGFEMLRELADLLGGEVAATRACVDLEWADKRQQVGQTGKTVRPKLYLACGISGAIQHVAGMEESECIIAINKEESAPIFQIATLGIVGDIYAILPKLIAKLRFEQML